MVSLVGFSDITTDDHFRGSLKLPSVVYFARSFLFPNTEHEQLLAMWVYQKMMVPPKPSQKQLFNRETLLKGTRQTHIHGIDGDCTNRLWPLLNTRVLLLAQCPSRSSCSVTFAQRKCHVFHQKTPWKEAVIWFGQRWSAIFTLLDFLFWVLSVSGFCWLVFAMFMESGPGREEMKLHMHRWESSSQTSFKFFKCQYVPVKLHYLHLHCLPTFDLLDSIVLMFNQHILSSVHWAGARGQNPLFILPQSQTNELKQRRFETRGSYLHSHLNMLFHGCRWIKNFQHLKLSEFGAEAIETSCPMTCHPREAKKSWRKDTNESPGRVTVGDGSQLHHVGCCLTAGDHSHQWPGDSNSRVYSMLNWPVRA